MLNDLFAPLKNIYFAIAAGMSLLLFVAGTSLALSDAWALHFIPIDIRGLRSVGTLKMIDGRCDRRLRNDILWLPPADEGLIYNGDSFFTGSYSQIKLLFDGGGYVEVFENSLVKIRFRGDIPLIEVKKGKVEAVASKNQAFIVKNANGEERRIELEQIFAPKTQEGDEEENDPNWGEELLEATAKDQELWANIEAPYPPIGTMILFNSPTWLPFYPVTDCQSKCLLRVFRDKNKIAAKTYKKGEVPLFKIQIKQESLTRYSWEWEGHEELKKGDFIISPFSEEATSIAIDEKHDIHVIN